MPAVLIFDWSVYELTTEHAQNTCIPEEGMATPEVQLARRLASNDYKTRRKAEKALKKWLSAKALKGMKEVEIQRLWKGLFACMFMSDKPLVQVYIYNHSMNTLIILFDLGTVSYRFSITGSHVL